VGIYRFLCTLGGLAMSACVVAPVPPDPAPAREIRFSERHIFPESLTRAGDGALIASSLSQPFIYKAAAGDDTARRWIDLRPLNSASYGVLADDAAATLWACTIEGFNKDGRPPALAIRRTAVRAFDLDSGALEQSWQLPGSANACNDLAVDREGTLYVTDTANGVILRLGSEGLEIFYSGPETRLVDGIAFAAGQLFFTSLHSGRVFRLPIFENGRPDRPIALRLSQALDKPDGMRADGARLLVTDNSLNQLVQISLDGNDAKICVLAQNLQNPVGVAAAPDRIWFTESRSMYWSDPRLAAADPNPFTIKSVGPEAAKACR